AYALLGCPKLPFSDLFEQRRHCINVGQLALLQQQWCFDGTKAAAVSRGKDECVSEIGGHGSGLNLVLVEVLVELVAFRLGQDCVVADEGFDERSQSVYLARVFCRCLAVFASLFFCGLALPEEGHWDWHYRGVNLRRTVAVSSGVVVR